MLLIGHTDSNLRNRKDFELDVWAAKDRQQVTRPAVVQQCFSKTSLDIRILVLILIIEGMETSSKFAMFFNFLALLVPSLVVFTRFWIRSVECGNQLSVF